MDWDVWSSVGLVRSVNEDSWALLALADGLYLAVVADGMGGYDGGEIASSLAVESVTSFVKENLGKLPLKGLLLKAIEVCNEKVFKKARSKEELSLMGTTLTVALLSEKDSEVHIAHIGDSRAYIIHDGAIRQITDDHSVTGELVRKGAISEEDAMKHPARNVLTMAVGTHEKVEGAMYLEKISKGDVVLLCTDGLTSLISANDILFALKDAPGRGVARRLTGVADGLGGPDNTTVLVLWPYRPVSGERRCRA